METAVEKVVKNSSRKKDVEGLRKEYKALLVHSCSLTCEIRAEMYVHAT